jgi:hypothetical protein
MDSSGKTQPLLAKPEIYNAPRLSMNQWTLSEGPTRLKRTQESALSLGNFWRCRTRG